MARHNWDQLKLDYLSGKISEIDDWAKSKGISANTAYKNTSGWQAEYQERQARITANALSRIDAKQETALAARFRAGRLLVAKGMREFGKKNLRDLDGVQLAQVVRIGATIQKEITDSTKPGTQVNVQVNNGITVQPIETGALIALGKALAGAKTTS